MEDGGNDSRKGEQTNTLVRTSENNTSLLPVLCNKTNTTLTLIIYYHLPFQIMNILRTAALVAIFIKCVTASTDVMSQFREAVDEGDMDKAVKLHPVEFEIL